MQLESENGEAYVKLTVSVKDFIPYGEEKLPVNLFGVPTRVVQGWISHCNNTRGALDSNEVLSPGLAIGGEGRAPFASLGAFVRHDNVVYGLTCGHVFQETANVFQPPVNGILKYLRYTFPSRSSELESLIDDNPASNFSDLFNRAFEGTEWTYDIVLQRCKLIGTVHGI